MADFEVTSARKEPSVLDVDWQHEEFEPESEHDRFHPIGGSPPHVQTPDNVLDVDFHPDPRSDIYGGYDEYNNLNPNVAVSRTSVLDSAVVREAEQLAKARKELEVAELRREVENLKMQTNAISKAQRVSKEGLI